MHVKRPMQYICFRSGTQDLREASGTVKVKRDLKVEDTVRARLVLSVDY